MSGCSLLSFWNSGRRSWRSVSAVLVVLVAGLFAWGADRVPAIPTQPLELFDDDLPPELTQPRFRVGSFNIHGGKSRENVLDLQRTATALASARLDVVGLSEVHGYLWARPRNQAAALGKALSMGHTFAPTERRFWHDHFGNGLLTSVQLTQLHRFPLPCTQGYKYRNAVLASFRVNGEVVHLLTVHIDRVKDRERQLRQVIELFRALSSPAILMGDFNTTHDDPQLRELFAEEEIVDAVAIGTGKSPGRRIDWIITRGLQVISAGEHDDGTSDHPLVWAELELQSSADSP